MKTSIPIDTMPTPTAPGPAARRLPDAAAPVLEIPIVEAAVGRVGVLEAMGVYAPLPVLAWKLPRPRRPASKFSPAMCHYTPLAADSMPIVA